MNLHIRRITLAVAAGVLSAAPVAIAALVSANLAALSLTIAVAAVASVEVFTAVTLQWPAPRSDQLASAATALTLLAVWCVAAATAIAFSTLSVTLGLGLFVIGTLLRVLALRELGERFRCDVQAAPSTDLCTTGIYQRMRHPSELAILVFAAAAVATTGSLAAMVLALIVLLPLVSLRVAREDRHLDALYGRAYSNYRARVRPFGILGGFRAL